MKLIEKYTDESHIEFRDTRATVVLKDKRGGKVSYRGLNDSKKEIVVYRIDGGIRKDTDDPKCDYGLYTISSGVMRFIELKGSDIDRAARQIEHSIRTVLDDSITDVDNVHGRIVISKDRVPGINSSHKQKLEKLIKQKRGNLIIKCRELKEKIDE